MADRAERNIAWIEEYCRVPDGEHVGEPIHLTDWQKDIIRAIYGSPTRRAIISFGRKNGKTALSAMLCLLHLAGREARVNSQLFSAAQSREQAGVLYNLAAKMVRLNPVLSSVITPKESAKELVCADLGTRYRALSADATTAYGLSPVFVVHDELGQVRGPRSELYEALETGSAAHAAPLSIVISTQAPNDDDLLSVLIDDAKDNPEGKAKLFLFTANDDADPFSEDAIRQANPAYGIFQNAEEVRELAEGARRMPSREAEYRNLILNQRVETQAPYVTRSVWDANGADPEPFTGPVYAGLDLSATADLTAFVLVGKRDGAVSVRPTFWLPAEGLREKARADRVPYDVWAKDGHLKTCPGATVDYKFVAAAIRDALRSHDIRKIAFDRWNMKNFRPWLIEAGVTEDEIERVFVEFGQGFASMSPALRDLDEILLNGRARHGKHPVLSMCAANAVVKPDPAGNRKLVKLANNRRIDGMIALAMAVATMAEAEEHNPLTPWDLDPEYRLTA